MRNVLQYLLGVSNLMEKQTNKTIDHYKVLWKLRVSYDIIFSIAGWSSGIPTNYIETYGSKADRWLLSVDNDNITRAYHGLCTLNGFIDMIGGFDGNEHLNMVRCFDPINHKWTECAHMYFLGVM
ncbi:hypothetical protein FQA39_LY01715 [Lamprigera yunnana]|nr:hypothetical protein FQA39_LY01715 [Lamprigera yunnana]